MQPAFAIDVDVPRDLVRMTIAGFFDNDSVVRFAAEREAAMARLKSRPNRHVTLCDVSNIKLAPQDVVGAFSRLIGDPRFASRRLAFVIGGSLARMQLRRIAARDNIAFFDHAADAEAWLLAEPADDDAA